MVNLTDSYSIVTDGVYEEPFLLYVGVGGDVNVIMDDGNEVLFKNVRSGTFMPVFVKGVRSFGTSASGFLASKTSEVKVDSFKITIDTTQAGSASDTFVLPLASGETYNFDIAWGDGTSETITSDTDVTHVYSSSGTYQISITGVFPRIYFNNGGDKAKLISIDNWGNIAWSSMNSAFYGCSNMNGTYTDAPDLGNVTIMYGMFRGCSSFNQPVNFDTSNVTDMNSMFFGCSSFNQSISNFDTSNVTRMNFMFYNCSSFNQSVSNFDTSSVTNMSAMFFGCSSFNQSLATFDMTSVANVTNMLSGCDINEAGTTTNYDNTLIAWAAQDLVDGLSFNGGNSKYSSTGATARQAIIDDDNWTITDGGIAEGILDLYTGAAAAYSLRQLRAGSQTVVRVRRDSDNAEQDFTATEITDGTLEAFVGVGNNGFVTTWYDQSSNGNDATQGSAAAQPKIVSAGVLVTENGKASIDFDGLNDFLSATDSDSLSFTDGVGNDKPISAFATFKITDASGSNILFGKDAGGSNREYAWGYFGQAESRFFLKNNGGSDQISRDNKNAGQLNLHQQSTMLYDASEVATGITFYSNGVVATMGDALSQTYAGMSNTSADFTIGNYGAAVSVFTGVIQEIIIYPSDQSTNRSGIETNINNHYNIYS